MVALDCLDFLHLTFLFYLRAFFRRVGFFVGTHPWKVIVAVNCITMLCAYAAVSVMWPFVYNPELNYNIIEQMDESFAQQDGVPLLTKQWAKAQFGEEKFASVLGYTEAPDHMLHTNVLRDLARIERNTLNTTLIPWRNYGFKQYPLDSSLGFFDFCARSCPKAEGCGCKAFSLFSLLKADHDDICNDAKNATFDLGKCYDALDAYYDDAAGSTSKIVTTIQELATAHETGNCHGNTDYATKVADEVASRITAATNAGDSAAAIAAIPATVAQEVTADFLKCTSLQGVPLGAVMEDKKSSALADVASPRFLLLNFFLGGRNAENKDAYLIAQWQRAWVEMMLSETMEYKPWPQGNQRVPGPSPAKTYEFMCSYSQDYSNEEMNIELLSLMPWSLLIVVVLAHVMLTNPKSKLAGNRLLVNSVIQTAAASPVIGIGLAAWCLIPNGPLNLVCFFLCIGTAMADTFIMTAEAQRVVAEFGDTLSLPEYGATVLSRAGPFGLMTTITTVIAFGIGMNTVYPSMVLFAKYAMLVMSFAHFYVITYFIANLVLKEDRIRKRKHDGCPFITITTEEPPGKKPLDASLANTGLEKFVDRYVAPAITSPRGKVIVMVTFLALVGVSIFGVTQIEAGMENADVTPANSHYTTFLSKREELTPEEGGMVSVYLSDEATWYDEPMMLDINARLWQRMGSTPLYAGAIASPWITFNETCYFFGPLLISGFSLTGPATDSTDPSNTSTPLTSCYQSEEAFQMALYHFMYTSPFNVVGGSARESIIHEKSGWAKAITKVRASHMSFSKRQEGSSANRYLDLVERVEAISFFSGMKQVSGFDTLDALEPLVVTETLTNIFMGAFAVFCSMMLFIKPAGAIIVVITILFLDLLLMAFLPLTGTTLNAASSICIVMAVGFAIDYSSDIVFAFFVPKAMSHNERARFAMVTMAQPIFVGGAASAACVAPLAAASVPTAAVFATMVGGIVFIGIYMGFIVLPVLLTLFTPLSNEAKGVGSSWADDASGKGSGGKGGGNASPDHIVSVVDASNTRTAPASTTPSEASNEAPAAATPVSPPPSAPSSMSDRYDTAAAAPAAPKTAWGLWGA